MLAFAPKPKKASASPIWFVTAATCAGIVKELDPVAQAFIKASGYEPTAGRAMVFPDASGSIGALSALESVSARHRDVFLPGKLVTLLPARVWRFANAPHDTAQAALAWLLASYVFRAFRSAAAGALPRLVAPDGIDVARIERIAAAVGLGRDLINRPANDLGPQQLEEAALALAGKYAAKSHSIVGDDLIAQNFPLIHAVGRASAQAPRLVDFTVGPAGAPRVTIVGKGVCFDTGGLDIKPSASMLLMKKDMGGAATALALAAMVMDAAVPVRLRVLLPIVENAIAGNAFRASDVYRSRKGITVEIGNTDAEGRLILADALALADEEAPDLMIDFATLTGAARVALGPELPPFYTDDDALAADIARHALSSRDPVWRMPLWPAYEANLDSKVADVSSTGGPFAGSVTAALFLRRFVQQAKAWVHFDIYAWNASAKPGRPEGGEIQAARMLYALIEERYGARARRR